MNKKLLAKLCVILNIALLACQAQKSNGTMQLNGVDYPEIFVKSGYYFDKASMSDAQLASMKTARTVNKQIKTLLIFLSLYS